MKKSKIMALLLSVTMVVSSLAGCGGKEESSTNANDTNAVTQDSTDGELRSISFSYGGFGTVAADACPRLEKYLAEKLGIKMDIWVNSDGVTEMNNMLASGEYADILIWNTPENIKTAADGGNLVDLMQYKDKLPAIFENDLYAGALERIKDDYGNGEALYGLPIRVGAQESVYAYSPSLRFDVYQNIGAPEITDWDSFLDVLEKMQKAYPETEEGMKTYALSMAGTDISTIWYNVVEPRGVHDTSKTALVSQDMKTVQSIFDEGSALIEGLQFLFDANQRGLMDPDGMTQTSADYQAKVSNGQIMYVPFEWWGATNYNTSERTNADTPIGYAQVWPECFVIPASADNVCGNIRVLAITTACKDIDAALEYVNWLYSDEGAEMFLNDVEGYLYTVDENGNKVPTEAYFTGAANEDGSSHVDLQTILGNDPTITSDTINPKTGTYYGIEKMEAFQDTSNDSKLKQEWLEWNGGYRSTYEKYKDTDQLVQLSNGFNLLDSLPDDIAQIDSTLYGMLCEVSVKMVYAKDQAEFDALWAQFKEEAYQIGYEQMFEACQTRYDNARAKDEKYSGFFSEN